jgi:hypothetical protein
VDAFSRRDATPLTQQEERHMRRVLFAAIAIAISLSVFGITSLSLQSNRGEKPADSSAIRRDLVFLGPAKVGMTKAGFNPSGSITVFHLADEQGTDKMKVEVEGLPANTNFTVFLHELSDIPFGSSQYIADLTTNRAGRGSVMIRTVILEAFALKTAGDPPTVRMEDANLKFVAIWFADPKDSAAFLPAGFPALAFDGDRSSGAVVLGTVDPLPNP